MGFSWQITCFVWLILVLVTLVSLCETHVQVLLGYIVQNPDQGD